MITAGDVQPNPGPSNLLGISHMNMRSFSEIKLDHIKIELTNRYQILTFSETWLKSSKTYDYLKINGYQNFHRKERANGYGGVAVFVADNIYAQRRLDLEILNLEIIFFTLFISHCL